MSPTTDLRDKVALVTGGASGLGRATVLALAEAGAEVVVADLNEADGTTVAEQVGGHYVRVDVSDLEENRAMVAFATERCGGVDLAFLNAGCVRLAAASIETTAPTLPRQIAASRRSKPGRATPEAETPRSSSITTTSDQPRLRARSASAYWRRRLS